MPKYGALTAYLQYRAEPVIVVSFGELDRLIDGLPPSARRHAAWWANSTASQNHARSWLDAGRRAQPDFNSGRVRFTLGSETRRGPRSGMSVQGSPRAPRQEASLRPATVSNRVVLTFTWLNAGQVTLEGLKLLFPALPAVGGIYRFTLAALRLGPGLR
jgi:hypothetical protein